MSHITKDDAHLIWTGFVVLTNDRWEKEGKPRFTTLRVHPRIAPALIAFWWDDSERSHVRWRGDGIETDFGRWRIIVSDAAWPLELS